MKRVTLMKFHPGVTALQALKTLRESTRNVHSSTCAMGLLEAKNAVDAIRFKGETPTVKVEQRDVLAAAFEYRIVPDADHFYATHHDSTVLVTDNYPVGADGHGDELFFQCADGEQPMAAGGVLAVPNHEDYCSASISRKQAKALYEFLGDWLGKS